MVYREGRMDTVVLFVVGLVVLVSFIWVVVIAFQTHIAWGLVCLFLPVAMLVFAILHWNKVWKVFLVNLASSLLFSHLAFSQISSVLGDLDPAQLQARVESMQSIEEEILRRLQKGEMTEEQAEHEMRMLMRAAFTGEPYEPGFRKSEDGSVSIKVARGDRSLGEIDIDAKIQAALEEERSRRAALVKPKPKRVQVFLDKDPKEAFGDIGKPVRVTTATGLVRAGDLVNIDDEGQLLLEKRLQGGTVVYPVRFEKIARYEVKEWIER